MEKWEKRHNIVGASVFGALGLTALIGALFFGATHQFVMVALCGMMVWSFISEIKIAEKRAKAKNNNQ
jgi:ABC-type polysaccharide/polyol phosphate export permease